MIANNRILLKCIVSLIAALSVSNALAQESVNETVIKNPKLSDLEWIAGDWHGDAMGGQFEESWNPPSGGSMVGTFKLVKNNKVVFYELLTIVETEDSLLLRLKHFDAALKGWEEKDKSVEFNLKHVTKSEAVFDGLRFEKTDSDKLKIVVNVERGGQTNELTFDCVRRKK